jgi:hypothetical protein
MDKKQEVVVLRSCLPIIAIANYRTGNGGKKAALRLSGKLWVYSKFPQRRRDAVKICRCIVAQMTAIVK